MVVRAVGISWFREEDYLAARAIMTDQWRLPPTYAAWLERAEKQEREYLSRDLVVHRAIIDPDTFPEWCAARNLDVDAKARIAFGIAFAEAHVQTH